MDLNTNFVETALTAGMQLGERRDESGHPYLVLPVSAKLESLEHLLPAPLRKKRNLTFHEAASFARYVQDYGELSTVIFADLTKFVFTAVIDYDETAPDGSSAPGAARWASHRAVFPCPLSELWLLWTKSSNVFMGQREFAEFLESNTAQIRHPDAAQFLEIAQTLCARTTVTFTGSVRLAGGNDQINFEHATETKAGEKGNLQLPSIFTLGLPVFQGGPPWEIKARLRHQIGEDKKLKLKYELVNPSLIVRSAWDEQVAIVRDATKLIPFMGTL